MTRRMLLYGHICLLPHFPSSLFRSFHCCLFAECERRIAEWTCAFIPLLHPSRLFGSLSSARNASHHTRLCTPVSMFDTQG